MKRELSSSSEISGIERIFCLELAPLTRETDPRGIPSCVARKLHRRSFAFPSVGGAEMRILRLSPSHPTSSSFDAFGITLTEILQEGIRGGHSKWSFGGSMSNRRAVFGVGLAGSPMVRLPKLWQFTGAGHCFWEYHEHMRFGLLILCLLLTGTSVACSQDDLRRDIRLIRRAFLDVTGLVPTGSNACGPCHSAARSRPRF